MRDMCREQFIIDLKKFALLVNSCVLLIHVIIVIISHDKSIYKNIEIILYNRYKI